MDFGLFYFDINQIVTFFQQPVLEILIGLFAIGGWLVFAYLLLYVAIEYYVDYRQSKGTADWEWVVLAIDIPALNLQTPVAVEQMFSHLAGAFSPNSFEGKYYQGYRQKTFSFEIISIEGYIQFIIRTEKSLQDLVESALYAQYPEAEIVEIEDYTQDIPSKYPNKEYDVWGADFGLAEKDAFPIRTHMEFEHNISKDDILKDPMSAFLESLSRIGKGEQLWFQIMLEPISSSWKEKSIALVKEMLGDTSVNKIADHIGDKLVAGLNKTLEHIGDQVFGREPSGPGEEKSEEKKMVTPGQKKVIEGIEAKISKVGFKTKIRAIYVAKKESFKPDKGVHGLIGAINQFNNPSSNSIVPKFGTGANYFFKDKKSSKKKTLMMTSYKKRKAGSGSAPFILNVEELATLWHFPMATVRTPLLQKAAGKRAEPPSALPIDITEDVIGGASGEATKEKPPEETNMRFG